jgi:hypothetical protein
MESVFVRLPEHNKAEGSKEIEDETKDNQVVITMEGGGVKTIQTNEKTQWLLDSGATVHVTNDADVLLRARKSNEQVRAGNGEDAKAERIGDVEMIVEKNDKFLLKDVLYVPGFLKNVVSLTNIVNNGITVQLDKDHVKFGMNGKILKVNKHRKDDMWYIKSITRTPNKIMAMDQKKMDINEAHEKLGHPRERTTRLTIESYGWTATGEFKLFDACLKDKARAKDVSHKPSEAIETEPGGRLYLHTTGPFTQNAGGTKYDATLVDQASSFGWATHLKAKSDAPEVLDQHAKYLEGKGYKIKKIRCDNAGEHQTSLKKVCERYGGCF